MSFNAIDLAGMIRRELHGRHFGRQPGIWNVTITSVEHGRKAGTLNVFADVFDEHGCREEVAHFEITIAKRR